MPEHSSELNLQAICIRCYSLALYKSNARWRQSSDISRDLLIHLKSLKIPLHVKRQISNGLIDIFEEVKRWGKYFLHLKNECWHVKCLDEKHAQMFPEEQKDKQLKKRRVSRADHLRMFHEGIVWEPNR